MSLQQKICQPHRDETSTSYSSSDYHNMVHAARTSNNAYVNMWNQNLLQSNKENVIENKCVAKENLTLLPSISNSVKRNKGRTRSSREHTIHSDSDETILHTIIEDNSPETGSFHEDDDLSIHSVLSEKSSNGSSPVRRSLRRSQKVIVSEISSDSEGDQTQKSLKKTNGSSLVRRSLRRLIVLEISSDSEGHQTQKSLTKTNGSSLMRRSLQRRPMRIVSDTSSDSEFSGNSNSDNSTTDSTNSSRIIEKSQTSQQILTSVSEKEQSSTSETSSSDTSDSEGRVSKIQPSTTRRSQRLVSQIVVISDSELDLE